MTTNNTKGENMKTETKPNGLLKVTLPCGTVIETVKIKPVMHRTGTQGEVITAVHYIRAGTALNVVCFWHDWQSMRFARVTHREADSLEIAEFSNL